MQAAITHIRRFERALVAVPLTHSASEREGVEPRIRTVVKFTYHEIRVGAVPVRNVGGSNVQNVGA